MANNKITYVNELDASLNWLNMKVRIIRRWINPVQKLEMVLVDEKGGKIQLIYTVEFQKRGLPHAHICLFLGPGNKFPRATDVDRFISAEIPDPKEDPELYELVKQFMMHGPCGTNNPKCPCMVKGKCTKNFPKKWKDETAVDSKGYPVYRRRKTEITIEKSGIPLDNGMVVPYNATLLRRYQCHINVEWCNQSGSIKYLFKYINKGPDGVTATVYQQNTDGTTNQTEKSKDEVKNYLDCRYVSASEAAWQIFGFDIHYRYPPVEILPFHLENEQSIVYDDEAQLCDVVANPTVKCSMFLQWMELNATNKLASTLKYVEIPQYFVWVRKDRKWKRRTIEGKGSIGRICYVPPSLGDIYYLRIMLNHVIGPKSFEEIKTVNGRKCETFKEACFELGLLDDDKEYVDAILEASHWASASYLRTFFVQLLLSSSVARPDDLWNKTFEVLSEDILHTQRRILNCPGNIIEEDIKNLCLSYIEQLLVNNGSTLKNFPDMPYPNTNYVESLNNRLIANELLYDKRALTVEHQQLHSCLTPEQRQLYETMISVVVISVVGKNEGGVYFVYGYGGTGKTYLWKTLTSALRSQRQIVLNVASSGIASLLLTGGRTAHSRFVIPININENSICSIDPNSELAALIKVAKLIIWDEAPMIHKHCFEALDRTMRDILRSTQANSEEKIFGGKVVVFGGDFGQILPVIPKGTRSMIVNSSLNSSYIWHHCQVLKLTINMRLQVGTQSAELEEVKEFAEWILKVGDGVLGGENDGEADQFYISRYA
uniref:uncharacterized protein LOC122591739 n=1 Tax=Erigeron canadensis TaxID=72917 RepID=UPI001CB8A187|nr:uncharacterized protein LOC122591739 [Erigeron canadensis]